MILKNSFYHIVNYTADNSTYEIGLNAEHKIFKAHFPERPITPGVCLVQIVLELMEVLTQKKLTITKVKNVKFLSVISPAANNMVNYTFTKLIEEEHGYSAQVHVHYDDVSYAKISLSCTNCSD